MKHLIIISAFCLKLKQKIKLCDNTCLTMNCCKNSTSNSLWSFQFIHNLHFLWRKLNFVISSPIIIIQVQTDQQCIYYTLDIDKIINLVSIYKLNSFFLNIQYYPHPRFSETNWIDFIFYMENWIILFFCNHH